MASLQELKKQELPVSSKVEDYNRYISAVRTQDTGFLEFKPRDIVSQARYDAMSPTWEGIDSTNEAIARGDYSLDSAEANRDYLRKNAQPVYKNPEKQTSGFCVIQ
jgi:hypothetical protein